jgi:hypothetical protein
MVDVMRPSVAVLSIVLAQCVLPAFAGQATPEPLKIELKLIHIFEGPEPTHLFVIGDSGFTTVESLKGFLSTLPAGSEIKWAPGCMKFGKEPLLSSEKDLEAFKLFLKREGLSLRLIPSG